MENISWPSLRSTWSNLAWSTRHLGPRCYDKTFSPGGATLSVGEGVIHLKGGPPTRSVHSYWPTLCTTRI
jgi:hypothetical protein